VSEGVDRVLQEVRHHLDLEAEVEHELLAELRCHLEDAVAHAATRGVTEDEALVEAAARFGLDEVGQELQAAHQGLGTADGVVASALPVICALILRWLVFAPEGTAGGWREMLIRPTFWVVATAALLVPLLRFPRRRYALASWAIFWVLSVAFFALPALRW
jgi:hypothetical protein